MRLFNLGFAKRKQIWRRFLLASRVGVAFCALIGAPITLFAQSSTEQRRSALTRQQAATAARAQASAAQAADAAEQAARLLSERRALTDRLSALGVGIQERERALEKARSRFSQLRKEIAAARVRRSESQRRLQRFISKALRAAREPTPSLLAHPGRPVEAARSSILMRSLAKVLREAQLEDQRHLDEIGRATAEAREIEASAKLEIAAMIQDERTIRALLDQKAEAEAQQREAAKKATQRASELGRRAQSLGELARSLSQEQQKQRPMETPRPTAQAFADAKGALPAPAVGDVAKGEGKRTKGVYVSTRPYARVISPWSGVVLFADDFMSEGKIVIIEPQKGYSLVISGLASLETTVGAQVAAGEPIGRMGGPPPSGGEFLLEWTGEAEAARETLYLEIWGEDGPVDALKWLRSRKARIAGAQE